MTTIIVCTHADCRNPYRVPPDVVGHEVKCKKCGRTFLAVNVNLDSSIDQSVKSTLRKSDPEQSKPAAPSHAKSPQRIGRFEVRKKLGHGAFGNVYRAYDPQLDREVAIKVPQAGLLATPEFTQRFLREAKAAARLNHPHIVPVYDAGQDGDQSYIASKFIDGQPLSDLVDDFSNDYRCIAEVIRQIAEAIHYAHTQKIIHRDIKPHNVMIDTEGEPHLMDFGLAQLGTEAQKLTHDGALMGTPVYMSPEQAAGKTDEVTAASDQYSLGVVLYELLTGETPFAGSPAVVIYNILNRPLPGPRTVNPKIPRDLETICLKSLAKETRARYPNCGAFAADLDRWLHDRPIMARRVSLAEQTLRWCRRNPVVAGLSVAVLAAILIGGGAATVFGLIARQRAAALDTALTDVGAQKRRADDKAEEARKALDQLEPEKMRALENASEATLIRARAICEQGDIAWGLLELCRALEFAEQADSAELLEAINWNISAWSAYAPELVAVLPHPAEATCAAATADGSQLITGCRDGRVRIWRTGETMSPPVVLEQSSEVHGLAIWPNSNQFVTLGADGQFRVWDAVESRLLITGKLIGPTSVNDHLSNVSCDPKSRRFAVGSWHGAAIYDASLGSLVTALTNYATEAVHFMPDGQLATLDNGTRLQMWSKDRYQQQGQPIRTAEDDGVRSITLSTSANSKFAGAGQLLDHAAVLISLREPKVLARIRHAGAVTSVSFSPDSKVFYSGSEGKVKLYDLKLMSAMSGWLRHPGMVRTIECFGDQGRFATAGGDGAVRIWQTPHRHRLHQFTNTERVSDICFSPDGKLLATACGFDKPELRLWDAERGKLLQDTNPPQGSARAIAFTPDGESAYVAVTPVSGGGEIFRWPLHEPFPTKALAQFRGEIWRFEISRTGDVIGFGTWDGVGYGSYLTTGNTISLVPTSRNSHVLGVSLSPDGRFLLGGGHDRQALLTNAADCTKVIWQQQLATPIAASTFHPSGKSYFLGGVDGVIRQFDLATQATCGPSMRHEAGVSRLRFTADGKLLASASGDGTARFWHVGSGQPVGPTIRLDHQVLSLALSPTGAQVAVGDDKGNVGIWSVPQLSASLPWAVRKLATELATGLTLDDDLGVRVLESGEWLLKHQQRQQDSDGAPVKSNAATGNLAAANQRSKGELTDSALDEKARIRLKLAVKDEQSPAIRVRIQDHRFRVLAKMDNLPLGDSELSVANVEDGKYFAYFDSPGYAAEVRPVTIYQGDCVPAEVAVSLTRKQYVLLRYVTGVSDGLESSRPANRFVGPGITEQRMALSRGGRFAHFNLDHMRSQAGSTENSSFLSINCSAPGVGFAAMNDGRTFEELELAPVDAEYRLREVQMEPGSMFLCRVCRGTRPGWDYGKLLVEAVTETPPEDIPRFEWQNPADVIGKKFLVELKGTELGNLWGSDPYTGDSVPSKAAVHAGLLDIGETRTVMVTVVEPPTSFPGSSKNGVTAGAWGQFPTAFSLGRPTEEEQRTLKTVPVVLFFQELTRGP